MKKRNQKLVSLIMSAFLAISIFTGVNPTTAQAQKASSSNIKAQMRQAMLKKLEQKTKEGKTLDENAPLIDTKPSANVRVIVQLQDEPAVKNNSKTINSVKSAQKGVIDKVKALTGSNVRRSFGYLVNGFSVNVKASDISKIKALPGVKSVTQAKVYEPDMSFAKSLTQAYSTWKDLGYKGEGMVISIIDTGVDYTHKDMKITNKSTEKLTQTEVSELGGKGKYYNDKVPYGYNFADENQDVIDANPSDQHGTHVAGIVAANGDASQVNSFTAVQGVAPEAQLLAMKVFPNTPGLMDYASDDDVIAAIEDSVLHKADVINMSLGSKCAFSDPNDPEQIAIKNATDKGVLCVISAGNSAISSTTNGWNEPQTNELGIVDTETVGAPGLAKDSLCVSSYENTDKVVSAMDYTVDGKTDTMKYAACFGSPEKVIKNLTSLVDCGLGKVTDFANKVLTGKVALVARGDINFAEKEYNAQTAGAQAIIIYDKPLEQGGSDDPLSSIFVDPSIVIPVIGMGRSDGLKLVGYLKNNQDVQVKFTGTLVSTKNSIADQMSPFTSWGPTPSLEFKPEITAPGGNIYSLQNNNKYTTMSGTSMAAPHTSGAEALIIQAAKKNLGLAGRELVEYCKDTAINTAKVLMNKQVPTIPYSPRQQGAGLIQIEDAINNPVIITDDTGSATVALKEIKSTTATFNLNLKNYSTSDVTYNLENNGVLSEKITDKAGHFSDYSISGSSMTFSTKNNIVVPAKGTAKVTVTVTIPSDFSTGKFVEGYVKFNSSDAKVPSLSVPYLGFYGDWSKDSILDQPAWSKNSLWKVTCLDTVVDDSAYPLGLTGVIPSTATHPYIPIIDSEQIAFSTNEDSLYKNAFPVLTLLRNAKTMDVDVVNSNDGTEKVLRKLSTEEYLRKDLLQAPSNGDLGKRLYDTGLWDGTIYNQSTGKYEKASDGQYYIRLTAKVDLPDAKPQTMYMPVKIDSSAPKINITSVSTSSGSDQYTLYWTETDNITTPDLLVGNTVVMFNGMEVSSKYINYDENTHVCSCTVKLELGMPNNFAVGTYDMAGNMTTEEQAVDSPVVFDNLFDGLALGKRSLQSDGSYKVTGKVDSKVAEVKVNGTAAAIDNNKFSVSIALKEGINKVTVEAFDKAHNPVTTASEYIVGLFTQGPTINLESLNVKNGETIKLTDESIILAGTIKSESKYVPLESLKVNGVELDKSSFDPSSGEFYYPMNLGGFKPITIVATDALGNSTTFNFITITTLKDAAFQIYFDNLPDLAQVQQIGGNVIKDGNLIVSGSVNHKPDVFKINGTAVTIDDNLRFSTTVKLATGVNKIAVYAEENAKAVFNCSYRLDYDNTAPVITFDSSLNIEDGKLYTNKDVLVLKGSVYDDTYGYTFNINNQYALDSNKSPEMGKANLKNFEYMLPVKNGDVITLTAVDKFNNAKTVKLSVVVDKEGPSVTISGVEEGKAYDKAVTPKIEITATKNGIASKSVTLDGKAYNGEPITTPGKHTLVATAKDTLGNETTKTVNFTINESGKSGSVVKTGSIINFENLMGVGSLVTLLGVVLFLKKRD